MVTKGAVTKGARARGERHERISLRLKQSASQAYVDATHSRLKCSSVQFCQQTYMLNAPELSARCESFVSCVGTHQTNIKIKPYPEENTPKCIMHHAPCRKMHHRQPTTRCCLNMPCGPHHRLQYASKCTQVWANGSHANLHRKAMCMNTQYVCMARKVTTLHHFARQSYLGVL